MKLAKGVMGATLAVAAVGLGIVLASSREADAAGAGRAKKKILVVTVTKGFRHDSIPDAEKTLEKLGGETGKWETEFARTDAEMQAKMTPAALKGYAAVVFANTTEMLPLPDPQGFLDWIKGGGGFVGMHAASDTFHRWPEASNSSVSPYIEMIGGEFRGHGRQCAVDGNIEDAKHPAMAPVVKSGADTTSEQAAKVDLKENTVAVRNVWKVFDEIYLFKNNDRAKLHVLLALDRHPDDGSPEANKPGDYLLAWSKAYGKGKVFYTALGHRKEVWADPLYQKHITGGILFAMGLAKGATQPASR